MKVPKRIGQMYLFTHYMIGYGQFIIANVSILYTKFRKEMEIQLSWNTLCFTAANTLKVYWRYICSNGLTLSNG